MKTRSSPRQTVLALATLLALGAAVPAAQAVNYTWSAGSFVAGSTAPSPLAAGDVLDILAGGGKNFNGASSNFTNGGTVNWNADPLTIFNGSAVVNNGSWIARSDDALVYGGGALGAFTNNGVFRKAAGVGATTIGGNVGFVNNGTLDAQVGSIVFVGGSAFNSGSVFTGAGVVNVAGGTNSFTGALSSSNLLLSSGTHAGNAAVIGGTVNWSGGTFSGTWAVGSGQNLVVSGGSGKGIDGAATQLTNRGTLAWNTTDALTLTNGATLRNEGVYTAGQSMSIQYGGGAVAAVQNTGTLRAAAGTTLTIGTTTGFVNSGTLDAQAGGTIRYLGGATFNAGTVFTGTGSNLSVGTNTFNGGFTSSNLVLASGTHTGGGAVINGNVDFTGGTLSGTWKVAAGQTLRGLGPDGKGLDGSSSVLTNQGTVAWSTATALTFTNGVGFVNQGLFVANASTSLVYGGGALGSFDNTSSGTVRAAAGNTLVIGSSLGFVSNGGVQDAEAGASIVYQGGSQFNGGSSFTGAGSNVATGSNTYAGALSSSNLVLASGTHTGTGAVIGGTVDFTGGTLSGTWTVAAGQTLRGTGAAGKGLDGSASVLTNQGTVAWNSATGLTLTNGATLANRGLLVANTSTSIVYGGGALSNIDNTATGTVRAAAGQTLTIGTSTGFVNNGGVLDAQAGASVVFAGGAQFRTGTSFTGAGSVVAIGSNGYAGTLTSSNLVLAGGTHTGTAVVLQGTTGFTGGTLSGTWAVAGGQTLRALTGGGKGLDGSATVLNNQGTLAWNTAEQLVLTNAATLNNAGTLNFSADGAVVYGGGAQGSFTNSGLIVKSGGSGTATIGSNINFSNTGTIDVQSGTVALPANFTNAGTLKGSGTYLLSGTLTNSGTVAPGASPGTLSLSGQYAQTAAGTYAVELQSLGVHDLFDISGTAALGGTLSIACWANCSLAVGDVVTILDSVGDLSGSFANVVLSGFATGAFNVIYDSVADRVQLQVTEAVTSAVPEPGSYALLLAGMGVLGWLARRQRAGAGG